MNLSSIRANFTFGRLPKLEDGQEWAKDPGCPECGLYPRSKFERTPVADEFRRPETTALKDKKPGSCPSGYYEFYTSDNRVVLLPKSGEQGNIHKCHTYCTDDNRVIIISDDEK